MQPLPPPDLHYWEAAQGWVGLRNAPEAYIELRRIRPELQSHPFVRAAWLDAWIAGGDWAQGRAAAEEMCRDFPEEPGFWLYLAYATRRVAGGGGLVAAMVILESVEQRFPKEWTIPFNLACYNCQMERLADAKDCLLRAMEAGGPRIRKMGLEDQDLKPLWPFLTKLGRA